MHKSNVAAILYIYTSSVYDRVTSRLSVTQWVVCDAPYVNGNIVESWKRLSLSYAVGDGHSECQSYIQFLKPKYQIPTPVPRSNVNYKQAVREAATICPAPASWPLTFWPWKWCDVGYHCANFSLPMPHCSRLRPDVRDRQTDVRQPSDAHHRNLSAYALWGRGIISDGVCRFVYVSFTGTTSQNVK